MVTVIKSYKANFPFADDIAIVEVKQSFFESAFVKPAKLNSKIGMAKLHYGTILTTFGYGQTPEGARASHLTFEDLEVVDRMLCGNGPPNYNWMCFREMHPLTKNLHDDCGDPIFFQQFLVGITSWISLDNRRGFYIAQNISSHEGYLRSALRVLNISNLRKLKTSAASLSSEIKLLLFTVLYNVLVL
ncbi:unnamed protein product [Hermetia illucens]|uniref:Peptidase S1 domain-containing protein n=1 Tax=Hermetia illucens TaxID=343691 RepID=A0A7R8UEI9_HERIL|nr:unnamed protein product [Hermetia illucens]